jgi:hypothetical protein
MAVAHSVLCQDYRRKLQAPCIPEALRHSSALHLAKNRKPPLHGKVPYALFRPEKPLRAIVPVLSQLVHLRNIGRPATSATAVKDKGCSDVDGRQSRHASAIALSSD